MKKLSSVVLNRRQMLALGLGTTAAIGLSSCGGGSNAPAPAKDEGSSSAKSDAAPATETEAAPLNADAFDALVNAGATATDDQIKASTWASKVKDAGKLRVGSTRTSTLFSLENTEDKKIRGFDAGLYQLLAKYILGDASKFDVTQVQSSTRESVLQSDQVDAVFATYSITDERKKVISFAGPYFTAHQGILVVADNTSINSVEDLNGKRVGTQEGSTGRKVLEEFAPQATVEELGTDEELRTALSQKRIDAYVTDSSLHMGSIVKNPGKYRLAAEFGPEDPYGIGLPLDSDGVAFVNEFLKSIEADKTWEQLWKICIGDRIGATTAPQPPAIA